MSAALTTGQLANLMGVTTKTVIAWIDKLSLPAYRLPGSRERRIPVRDALQFARAHRLDCEALAHHARRQGLIPLSPSVLLASDNPSLVMPLSAARLEVTVAGNPIQCGLVIAHHFFDAAVIDASLGMAHVRDLAALLATEAPDTLLALLANEDAQDPPPGFTLCWQKPVDMQIVASAIWECLKEKSG